MQNISFVKWLARERALTNAMQIASRYIYIYIYIYNPKTTEVRPFDYFTYECPSKVNPPLSAADPCNECPNISLILDTGLYLLWVVDLGYSLQRQYPLTVNIHLYCRLFTINDCAGMYESG